MNTLNTIIEEEKDKIFCKYDFGYMDGTTVGVIEDLNNDLDTAMQRAFEAGEREADAKWEREVEVVKKLLEVATCPDSSCNQEGVCIDGYGEPYQCQWCYERHDILSKIRS